MSTCLVPMLASLFQVPIAECEAALEADAASSATWDAAVSDHRVWPGVVEGGDVELWWIAKAVAMLAWCL